jgi:hypothetical protein
MFRRARVVIATTVIAEAISVPLGGQATGRFVPDWTFKGSALTGMQQIGQVTWRAENGEIIATPKTPEGGWLLLDRGYQDLQFALSFRCAGACSAGVMVRSEKTPDGIKGIYTTIAGGERGSAAISVDGQGRITHREPLTRAAGGQARFAPPRGKRRPGRQRHHVRVDVCSRAVKRLPAERLEHC